jgi:hypothetical protein
VKGKFRSFLLASFHISDAIDRVRCLKRGGGKEFVQLEHLSEIISEKHTERRLFRDRS